MGRAADNLLRRKIVMRLVLLLLISFMLFGCSSASSQDLGVPEDEPIAQAEQPVCSGIAWKEVSKGAEQTCAVTTGNSLYCWGNNDFGQLGIGSTTDQHKPTFVRNGVDHVYSGGNHVCAITDTSTTPANQLLCWGRNQFKQVKGTASYYTTPQTITGLTTPIKHASAGHSNTCVVDGNNNLRCWGNRSSCQDGVAVNSTPTDVPWLAPKRQLYDFWPALVTNVFVSGTAICGAANDMLKTVRCWGSNSHGALGNGTTSDAQCYPYDFEVPWKTTKTSVLSGSVYMVCAAPSDGSYRPYCAGDNGWGQLGRGYVSGYPYYSAWPSSVSTTFPLVITKAATDSGQNGITLATSGSNYNVWVWGVGTFGALGQNNEDDQIDPVRVYVGGNPIVAKSASGGGAGGCAVTSTGTEVYCWGRNQYGQLGDNTTTDRWTATPIVCP